MSRSAKPIHNNTTPAETKKVTPLWVLWQVIRNACCIFTLGSLVLILINWAMAGSLDDAIIFVDAFFLLYVFSLGVAAAHTLRMSKNVPMWVKCICHPILCLGGMIVAYLPYMIRSHFPAGTVMVHLLAFLVAYGIAMAVVYLTTLIGRGKKDKPHQDETQPYQPVFGKKGDDH